MDVQELRQKGWINFEMLSGSHAYGTSIEGSDKDFRGVFTLPTKEVLSGRKLEQVSDETNDITFYEFGRFLELLEKGNPNVLELLFPPKESVVYDDGTISRRITDPNIFITKNLRHTFGGYAVAQIKKAKGLNKKINQDKTKVERKGVLDFCYVLTDKEEAVKFNHWIKIGKKSEFDDTLKIFKAFPRVNSENLGLAKVNNFPDLYSMYYVGIGGGIVGKDSNDVQLRSIPKGAPFMAYLRFDKNAYSTHCKDYKEFKEWEKNRNPERYRDNLKGEQGYDHKNMMHCMRLLNTAHDIATTGRVIVRRPERDALLSIRNGEAVYEDLLATAEAQLEQMDSLFKKSSFPGNVNRSKVEKILLEHRLDNLKKL